MTDDSPIGINGTRSSWRTEANAYRKRVLAHLRGIRPAVVRARCNDSTCGDTDALRVNRAWDDLTKVRPRAAAALELHYVGGFELRSVASILGRSLQTGALDLRLGRALLERSLQNAVPVDEALARNPGAHAGD